MRFLLTPLLITLAAAQAEPPAPAARPKVAIEALQRLKNVDLEANPALKAAVAKIVESARGTPDFIQIARILDLRNEHEEILAIARREGPASDAAVEGIRLILAQEGAGLLRGKLATAGDEELPGLIDLLGNAGDPAAAGILQNFIEDPAHKLEQRNHAVRALARSETGAKTLLEIQLADDLKAGAAAALRVVPWPDIQAAAAAKFPAAAAVATLPPPAELATMRGDAARGATIAALPQTACLACHLIGDQGVDFGPALTEIGNKLSREALIESILDPAASISHGYKAWQLTLESGDSRAGFIISETEKELMLKEPSGIVVRLDVAEIKARTEIPGSMMPAGLQHTMTPAEFIDLIEYLASLKP